MVAIVQILGIITYWTFTLEMQPYIDPDKVAPKIRFKHLALVTF